ncbi:hypothetical protein [Piscinibacter gummiphilus]|uniref:Uncharacterized protein n=1 Tax=Piscinibacter gummiphilus TaxID=946333 RepID=A0ABZ0CPI6_9BURK|nr:hypothetical protein [Piscinibacter gummiphilus]WOB06888.1 hypothetical protein RXV79_18420 [Piscinibacter gummiphilus]
MFAFLKRQEKIDRRDIEQLIFDIAEHQREADFHLLYKLMAGREVFVGINRASLPTSIEPGVPYTTQASDRLEMKTVSIPNHGAWSSAATLASHPLLAGSYVGMQWFDFLRMTRKVPELRGAALQGKTSWVAFDKERIAYVLAQSGA